MKPQARITTRAGQSGYTVSVTTKEGSEQLDVIYSDYEAALDYILTQGWQLERDAPNHSLHVETRFLKP